MNRSKGGKVRILRLFGVDTAESVKSAGGGGRAGGGCWKVCYSIRLHLHQASPGCDYPFLYSVELRRPAPCTCSIKGKHGCWRYFFWGGKGSLSLLEKKSLCNGSTQKNGS